MCTTQQPTNFTQFYFLYCIICWNFATKAWPCFGGIFGMATANPYILVLLAASPDPPEWGLCVGQMDSFWASQQWWNWVYYKLLLVWKDTDTLCTTLRRWGRDGGGAELSRAVVAGGGRSETEHCSDAPHQWAALMLLSSEQLGQRWNWGNSAFAPSSQNVQSSQAVKTA